MRPIVRSQSEIVRRMQKHKACFLCFAGEILLPLLDFEHAKEFLKSDATIESWDKVREGRAQDMDAIEKEARAYMAEYGWGKARDHRGISAGRSVEKLTEWTWLLGHYSVVAEIDDNRIPYAQYGAPILQALCEANGWPIPDDEDLKLMMLGEPCRDCSAGESSGCGS